MKGKIKRNKWKKKLRQKNWDKKILILFFDNFQHKLYFFPNIVSDSQRRGCNCLVWSRKWKIYLSLLGLWWWGWSWDYLDYFFYYLFVYGFRGLFWRLFYWWFLNLLLFRLYFLNRLNFFLHQILFRIFLLYFRLIDTTMMILAIFLILILPFDPLVLLAFVSSFDHVLPQLHSSFF